MATSPKAAERGWGAAGLGTWSRLPPAHRFSACVAQPPGLGFLRLALPPQDPPWPSPGQVDLAGVGARPVTHRPSGCPKVLFLSGVSHTSPHRGVTPKGT